MKFAFLGIFGTLPGTLAYHPGTVLTCTGGDQGRHMDGGEETCNANVWKEKFLGVGPEQKYESNPFSATGEQNGCWVFSKNPQALSQHILGGWAAMTTSPYSNTELNWAKSQPGNASWERLQEVFADFASIFVFQKNWFIYQSLEHSPSWIKLPNLTIWIFLVVVPENYSEFIGREFPQRPSLVRDWKF